MSSKEVEAIILLREMLVIIEERDENGEPSLGVDHTGAVNWILSLGERIRKIVE